MSGDKLRLAHLVVKCLGLDCWILSMEDMGMGIQECCWRSMKVGTLLWSLRPNCRRRSGSKQEGAVCQLPDHVCSPHTANSKYQITRVVQHGNDYSSCMGNDRNREGQASRGHIHLRLCGQYKLYILTNNPSSLHGYPPCGHPWLAGLCLYLLCMMPLQHISAMQLAILSSYPRRASPITLYLCAQTNSPVHFYIKDCFKAGLPAAIPNESYMAYHVALYFKNTGTSNISFRATWGEAKKKQFKGPKRTAVILVSSIGVVGVATLLALLHLVSRERQVGACTAIALAWLHAGNNMHRNAGPCEYQQKCVDTQTVTKNGRFAQSRSACNQCLILYGQSHIVTSPQ
jgi:hypothetical protein